MAKIPVEARLVSLLRAYKDSLFFTTSRLPSTPVSPIRSAAARIAGMIPINTSEREEYLEISKEITQFVGGMENIQGTAHCATRLRIVLKDDAQHSGKSHKKRCRQNRGHDSDKHIGQGFDHSLERVLFFCPGRHYYCFDDGLCGSKTGSVFQ